jgi:hypothetical protein
LADKSAMAQMSANVSAAGAQEQMQKFRGDLLAHLRQEKVSFESRTPARFTRRPVAHDWCAAQSKDHESVYHFCEWLTTMDCKYFQCAEARDECERCTSGRGTCAAGLNTGVADGPDGAAMIPVSAPAAGAAAAAAGTSTDGEWKLPLGEAFDPQPVRRAVDGSLLGTGSFSIGYELVPLETAPAIAGRGLVQTYLIFGGPGAGKTYYFKHLLSSLLAHPNKPGCLLLDPKGVLTEWLADVLESLGRANDLVVLSAGANEHAFNVLGDDLPPKETGRLLTEVVLSGLAGIDEGWQVLIGDLLESAAVVIAADDGAVLTVASLLRDVLYREQFKYPDGKIQRQYPIVIRALKMANHPDVDVRIAADRIADFFESTEDKQRRFVRQIIERSLAEMVSPDWEYLSRPDKEEHSFYSRIIEGTRVVTVAVGQGSPAFQRSLSTLVKALFQQAVLANLTKHTGQRPFFILACDEYAQAITEGETGLVSDSRFFSLSREAGCLSLLALQSVATGRSRFTAAMKDRWEGILGNVTVKFFMRLNDVETAELGSSLAGSRHSFVPVVSTGISGTGASMNEAVTMLEHPRVPPWYLTNHMPQGYALVHGTLDGVSPPVSCIVRAPNKS